jgi:multidrug efflux pump
MAGASFNCKPAMGINPATGEEYLATDLENDFLQWMGTQDFVPADVSWRLRGANEEAEAATAFLGRAMMASLLLMFIILLMQFNSLYCTLLTLSYRCAVHHWRIAGHGADRDRFSRSL